MLNMPPRYIVNNTLVPEKIIEDNYRRATLADIDAALLHHFHQVPLKHYCCDYYRRL